MSVLMLSHVKPSWWWRACTLRERRDLLKGGLDAARPGGSRAGASETVLQEDGPGSQGRSVVGQDRAEDGKQRLERGSGQGLLEQWRKKALLLQDERFRQRLAADDLDEATMEALLHLANAEVCPLAGDVKEPEWVGVFREAMELAQEDDGKAVRCLGLDQAVRPFLLWALRAWERHFLPTPEDERIQWEPVIGSAIQTLGMELVQVAARTLVLELNVCRLREQLEGETPEERFQSFVRLLGRPEFLSAFYDEYAVLARLLTLRTKFYVNHVTELLDRYLRDVERLERELGLDGSPLVELHSGVGDAHRQGRTVTRLRFGSGAQVVYKPRPLAGAVRVQRLLRWLGEKGFRPELAKTPIHGRHESARDRPAQPDSRRSVAPITAPTPGPGPGRPRCRQGLFQIPRLRVKRRSYANPPHSTCRTIKFAPIPGRAAAKPEKSPQAIPAVPWRKPEARERPFSS
ncbi:MAG: DUF4135 domain-containing protein [Kyrpidia tusciae]|nr:DUF4135 domain-containing protein [Kyrpidia tusciae]MBE3552554.1 DUF4135 domain-containing protein [Kyrpidia tusciae]